MYKTKMNKPCVNFCNLQLTATLLIIASWSYSKIPHVRIKITNRNATAGLLSCWKGYK